MSEQERKWVPGFIWVTPRLAEFKSDSSGKYSWHFTSKPPVLIQVSQIADLVEIEPKPDRQDMAKTRVTMAGNSESCFEVIQSPEQVAALIRQEWRQRVMSEAIVQAEYGSGKYPVEGNVDEQEGT